MQCVILAKVKLAILVFLYQMFKNKKNYATVCI